ncbi:hypothetical protein AKJ16_DCAP15484 [Drosera capensis]
MVMRTSPTWSQAQNEAQSKMEQGQAQSLSKGVLWHSSLAELERSQGSFREDDSQSLGLADGNSVSSRKEAGGPCRHSVTDSENFKDLGSSYRVAIFKDTEKDHPDPDYDRSYDRYARNFAVGHELLVPLVVPKYQAPFMQYGTAFSQSAQLSGSQDFLSYGTSSDPTMTHLARWG